MSTQAPFWEGAGSSTGARCVRDGTLASRKAGTGGAGCGAFSVLGEIPVGTRWGGGRRSEQHGVSISS